VSGRRLSILDVGKEPSAISKSPMPGSAGENSKEIWAPLIEPSMETDSSTSMEPRPTLVQVGKEPSTMSAITTQSEGSDHSEMTPQKRRRPRNVEKAMERDARNKAMRAIYQDSTLTSKEKHEKIKELMQGAIQAHPAARQALTSEEDEDTGPVSYYQKGAKTPEYQGQESANPVDGMKTDGKPSLENAGSSHSARSHHSSERGSMVDENHPKQAGNDFEEKDDRSYYSDERSYRDDRSIYSDEASYRSDERSYYSDDRSYYSDERSHYSDERSYFSGDSYHSGEDSCKSNEPEEKQEDDQTNNQAVSTTGDLPAPEPQTPKRKSAFKGFFKNIKRKIKGKGGK
jgi:hypothetical protein